MNDTATAEQPATTTDDEGWEWCFLEIMGHRSHWGRSREEEHFGAKMVRIDVPTKGDPANGWTTHYYGGAPNFSYFRADEGTLLKGIKPYEPPSGLHVA